MISAYLYLYVVFKDAEAEVSRQIDLPFVPFVGLDLHFSEDEYEPRIAQVTLPVANSYPNRAHLWIRAETYTASEDCPCEPKEECCIFRPEEWEEKGWTVETVRRGAERFWVHPWCFKPEANYAAAVKAGLGLA